MGLHSANWFALLAKGDHYMKTWPKDKRLSPMFNDGYIVNATRTMLALTPPFVAFILTWQIVLGGDVIFASLLSLFVFSLPLQGLLWLGQRATSPLPPALLAWFHAVRARMAKASTKLPEVEGKPTYQALADLLQEALKKTHFSVTKLDDIDAT